MFDKHKILEPVIQPDDKLLLAKALDQVSLCMKNYKIAHTEFLDPHQISLCKNSLTKIDVSYKILGGYEEAERRVMLFYPRYMDEESIVCPIQLIKIISKNRFSENLNHRDYLGALLHLGIRRENIGDIVVHEGYAFVFVLDKFSDFIAYELKKIKRDSVDIEKCTLKDFIYPQQSIKEIRAVVSSLRLDSIASVAFGISRTKILPFIRSEKIKVNWEETTNPSYVLEEGDTISFKGHGRVRLKQVYGETKKGKIQIMIHKYV